MAARPLLITYGRLTLPGSELDWQILHGQYALQMGLFHLVPIDLVVRATTTSERESKYDATRLKVARVLLLPPFIVIVTGLVWPVLARMVNDAARYYKQNGEILVSRTKRVYTYIFEGLPAPSDADFSLSYTSGSLSEWKQRLFIVSSRSKSCSS